MATRALPRALMAVIFSTIPDLVSAAVVHRQSQPLDPFAPIDPQNWVNPDNMTWDGTSGRSKYDAEYSLIYPQIMWRHRRQTGLILHAKAEIETSTLPW